MLVLVSVQQYLNFLQKLIFCGFTAVFRQNMLTDKNKESCIFYYNLT